MNSLNNYILEKFKISKDIGKDNDDRLYIFIPYGFTYDFFYKKFNKIHKYVKFKVDKWFDVYFLTKEEILICYKDKDRGHNYDIYELPNKYQKITSLDDLADTISKDNLDINNLTHYKIDDDDLIEM